MMGLWTNLLIVFHVLVALAIIGLVLLQHGKGADMGSGFGTGASGSLFGATGSANFLSRMTAVLAALFFILSLALAYVATRRPAAEGGGVIDSIRQQQQQPQKPAAPSQSVPAPAAPAQPQSGSPSQPQSSAPSQPQSGSPSQPPQDKQVPQ
jgi:preprotein translocase subunit SecG